LRLVGEEGAGKRATDIFDNLDELRKPPPKQRPKHEIEPFVQLPYVRGIKFYRRHVGDAGWAILLELAYRAFKGDNPSLLNSKILTSAGVSGIVRARALERLEAAKLIKVEPQGEGKAPL
jgi:hypothetical protein